MKSAETTNSTQPPDALNDANSSGPEYPPITIQGRLVLAMFVLVGLFFGVIILADFLAGIFR